jgi:hypothetical protein
MTNTAGQVLPVALLGYLRKHCQGAAAARKLPRIARDLEALGLAAGSRDVREALAELRLDGWPVGTTCGEPADAFLCVSGADYRRAYRNLYGRLRVQARGCRRFKRTFQEAASGQRRFDFSAAEQKYSDLVAAPLLAAEGGA